MASVDAVALRKAAEEAFHREGWTAEELPEIVKSAARKMGVRVATEQAERIAAAVAVRPPERT